MNPSCLRLSYKNTIRIRIKSGEVNTRLRLGKTNFQRFPIKGWKYLDFDLSEQAK